MRQIETMRISEFEEMLRGHKFAITASSPQELKEVLEKESRLQQVAANGDTRYVTMFFDYQHKALENIENSIQYAKPAAANNEYNRHQCGSVDSSINFLEFRSRVRNFDWGYNTVQDRDRYNSGKKELEEIRQIAMERGGEFIRFWQDECQKRKLWAFTRSQNAALASRRY